MPDEELQDIDQIELSLTGAPAVKEDFIMVKSDKDKEKEVEEAKGRFAKFSELDDDARLQAFLTMEKAQHDNDDDDDDDEEKDKDKKNKKAPPEFNFDKADDSTKAALRTIGEAILNVASVDGVDMPAPIAEFAKSIKARLPKNGQTKTEEMIAFAKSNMPGLVEAIQEPIKKELGEVTKTVEELQADKDLAAMKEIAAELPGDLEIVAKRLIGFKKTMSEADFDAYIEEQKGLKTTISKSQVFERQSSGVPSSGSAEALIMGKAKDVMTKNEDIKTMSDAIEFVGKNDPVLWGQYQEEIRNRPAQLRAS